MAFPKDFMWAVASSHYQIEGGGTKGGRSYEDDSFRTREGPEHLGRHQTRDGSDKGRLGPGGGHWRIREVEGGHPAGQGSRGRQ